MACMLVGGFDSLECNNGPLTSTWTRRCPCRAPEGKAVLAVTDRDAPRTGAKGAADRSTI